MMKKETRISRRARKRSSWDSRQRDVEELFGKKGQRSSKEEACFEMMMNVSGLLRDDLDPFEIRLMGKSFAEIRYALSVFKKYSSKKIAAVFGSARTPRHHPDYKLAKELGRQLAKAGWMVITGGAAGIMEAAMVGAGVRNSFGLNIMLPFEQEANPIIRGNKKLMYFKYFFSRKLIFLMQSDATVLFPGGFGTMDEGFESFTLVQTGKAKPRPLILMDPSGSTYWTSLKDWMTCHMGENELISPGDLDLMRHFQSPKDAVNEMTGFFRRYHSSRFYKDGFLIRLHKTVSNKLLGRLNREFRDIVRHGGFRKIKDFRDDDEKNPRLERLFFLFDRVSYNRLRQLIDFLNHNI